jgi:hypothetical protein
MLIRSAGDPEQITVIDGKYCGRAERPNDGKPFDTHERYFGQRGLLFGPMENRHD